MQEKILKHSNMHFPAFNTWYSSFEKSRKENRFYENFLSYRYVFQIVFLALAIN
jgi:hypothetical protein